MELKFVSRHNGYNMVFPFPKDYKRCNGVGFIKKSEGTDVKKCTYFVCIYDKIKRVHEVHQAIDEVMSEFKEGDYVRFMILTNPENGTTKTITWNEDEWKGFVVNDDGKTVDSL